MGRTNGSRGLSGSSAFVQKFHVDISIIIFFSFSLGFFFFLTFSTGDTCASMLSPQAKNAKQLKKYFQTVFHSDR